jgi:hypothetical protein
MNRYIAAILTLSLIFVTLAIAAGLSGTLYGTVLDYSDPIPYATVKMELYPTGFTAPEYATADENGDYTKGLPAGSYEVTSYKACENRTKYLVGTIDSVYVPAYSNVELDTSSDPCACIE